MDFAHGKVGPLVVGTLVSIINCGWAQDSKPPLTGQVRATFIERATNSCLDSRDTNPNIKAIPASTVLRFCRCTADGMADRISIDELKALEAANPKDDDPPSAEMQTMVENVTKACIEAMTHPSNAAPPR